MNLLQWVMGTMEKQFPESIQWYTELPDVAKAATSEFHHRHVN